MKRLFKIVSSKMNVRKDYDDKVIYIEQNNWDDYGYRTTYNVIDLIDDRVKHCGTVKISSVKYDRFEDKVVVKESILNEDHQNEYVTLGDDEYYKYLLDKLSKEEREYHFINSQDLAFNLDLLNKYKELAAVRISFLRSTTFSEIQGKLNRLATGNLHLKIDIDVYERDNDKKTSIFKFLYDSESILPTNIHAIIGTNGSGKTKLLKKIVMACSEKHQFDEYDADDSAFRFTNENEEMIYFSEVSIYDESYDVSGSKVPIESITYISYSPFDDNKEFDVTSVKFIGYSNVKDISINDYMNTMLFEVLITDNQEDGRILDRSILGSPRKTQIWNDTIDNLSFDSNVRIISDDLKLDFDKHFDTSILDILSSGQKILLLSLAKLINEATDRSLLIIDEPELFLHPPLITSYIREISRILKITDSVCILATHSPLVIQEIPENCVSVITKGSGYKIEKPKGRTFGENIAVINESIFGTDLRRTGYYSFLNNLIEQEPDKAKELVNNEQLGFEAENILNSMNITWSEK